jgi:hypothetical protein
LLTQRAIVGSDARIRCENSGSGAPPAAWASSLISERLRSSSNGNVVSGRRGRDGELYVGSIYQDVSMSTLKGVKHSIEQIKSTGVDVELVTGAEADKLFTEMALRLQMSGAEQQEGKPN